ncbi:MAG: hypothetical protein GF390_02435, partial [Candidatus Pacebacteria bacterium]|nr:hypothetical protein [Candidatus Paceibacterota bacterium]
MNLKHLKTYWQLFWQFRKLQLAKLMEYRGDFIFWSVISTMWTIFNLFFFSLIVQISQGLAGWSMTEMYLLLGVFTMIDALTWSFFL